MRFKSQITIKRLRAPVVAFDLKLESSDTQLAAHGLHKLQSPAAQNLGRQKPPRYRDR